MSRMRPHPTEKGRPLFVSPEAKAIKRHRNPLGIFSRAFIYPLIGFGAWHHRLDVVAAGLGLEALLWTAVPPVEETFGFVEEAIETELEWLNAPAGARNPSLWSCWPRSPSSRWRDCGGAPGAFWARRRASSCSSTCS